MSGPLDGYRIIEIAGIGPGPFCGMMLADMGAEVIRVERKPPPPAIPGTSDVGAIAGPPSAGEPPVREVAISPTLAIPPPPPALPPIN